PDDEPAEPRFVPEPEDDRPAPAIALAADLPPPPPADDPDPASAHALDAPGDDGAALLAHAVAHVVGIRFAPAGRILWHDAGELPLVRGARAVVDSDRGPRLATAAVDAARRPPPGQLRRVLRRAGDADLRAEAAAEAQGRDALGVAKDKARALGLAIKVFRV